MTPEEFRTAGHALVDWIADHRTRVPQLPVMPATRPGEVAAAMPEVAPELPGDPAELLRALEQVVVPGVLQTQSPHFYGWFPSNASPASVLGDLASAGIAALGATWQSAPALTEVEEVVVDRLRELTGLSPAWHGVVQDTTSTGTLLAMVVARERAVARGGGDPVAYLTEDAHSSVPKAVRLAGFGPRVRTVAVDPVTRAMDPEALAAAMAADATAGLRPAAVTATLATTATTAFDPLDRIVPVAARHGAWVHVDGAMGGAALLLPELRHLATGLEGADSFCWNPHKWLGTVLDCSLMYVRDVAALTGVLGSDPSYLRSDADGLVTQYRDWGIPLGRRFRALKLWFQLHLDGVAAVRARLRRDVANAGRLAELVAAEPGWRVTHPVTLQTVCLRHEPPGTVAADGTVLDGDALDRHTLAWIDRVNASGRAFLGPAQVAGRWTARVSVGAEATEWQHVEQLWSLLRAVVVDTQDLPPLAAEVENQLANR